LDRALAQLGRSAEIIYVDDGSTDSSLRCLRELARKGWRVKVIALRRTMARRGDGGGYDAAVAKSYSNGCYLTERSADSRLLNKIDEGYDVVSGWRKNRQDKLFTRKISFDDRESNDLLDCGVPLHDYGCSLKAYRRESLGRRAFYGEMHRFNSDLRVVVRRAGHGDSG